MPVVSVILPTYNRSGYYLERAIQSVINQSYSKWELIVIDNNSSDDTIQSIFNYKDDRIKILSINNLCFKLLSKRKIFPRLVKKSRI